MVIDRGLQTQLDGRSTRSPRACLYVDESHSPGWLYVGVLVVPDDEADELQWHLDRCRSVVRFDRELHYRDVSTRQKADLARSWLDLAMRPASPRIRFHILGVNLAQIRLVDFGPSEQRDENIYRRCLRMALSYAAVAFLPKDAYVRRIVHDQRTISGSEYFEWHTPFRMRRDGHRVATDTVELVDSDHSASSTYRDSNFVQLIDVLLGASRDCLDATCGKQHRIRVAEHWLPLVQRLTDESARKNRRSSYGYVGRCNISFFPASTTSDAPKPSDFYVGRRPRLADRGQGTLFPL